MNKSAFLPLLFVCLFPAISCLGQSEFDNLLALGKEEFSKDFQDQDFAKAVENLEKAVALNPDSQEAHYFLGYAYDRLNSKDGASLIDAKLDLTNKAIAAFQRVIEINPKYEGEKIVLDPYSKFTSLTGSIAWSYIAKGQLDSARWAFKMGRDIGGFQEPLLEHTRNILDNCSENSILIMNGDMIMFPITYVQLMEGYRTDVTTIDNGLLAANWYIEHLHRQDPDILGLDIETAIELEYLEWQGKDVTLEVASEKYPDISSFTWYLKPTYYDQYLLKNNIMLLSILKKNQFKKEVFFSTGFDPNGKLSLNAYLRKAGLVEHFVPSKVVNDIFAADYDNILMNFKTETLQKNRKIIENSYDLNMILNNYRFYFINRIRHYQDNKQDKQARQLKTFYKNNLSEKVYPYAEQSTKDYLLEILER